MNMFDTYDNIQQEYIPSNMNNKPCPPKPNPFLDPAVPKKPYCEYNAEGKLVGYWWTYGDTVNLEFDIDGYVTVDGSDNYISVRDYIKDKQIRINIYNFRHEQINTMLFDGKDYQAPTYSRDLTVNNKTHGVYYKLVDNTYIAVNLPEEYEAGVTYYKENDVEIIFPIDEATSLTMEKGTYYCSLTILGKDLVDTIFYEDDCSCTLMVR